ncbi:unnamed protein product [Lupinus luteus]|uniref:Uncharacterized protein n=1 Tax=Lupinus luteus TaxID=3873 RepID=A0AAV1XRU7_LUPLU
MPPPMRKNKDEKKVPNNYDSRKTIICGEKEEAVFGLSNQKPNMQEKQLRQRKQLQHQKQVQKYPFDVFVSEKREVPNASDPLHNR